MTWTIYRHMNKVTGKSYVGRTKKEPKQRWGKCGFGYKYGHPKFWNAIQKYGWEEFEHEIIAETDTEVSGIFIETMFKKRYSTIENGYNCVLNENESPMLGRKHSAETKKKISEAHKGIHSSPDTEFKKGCLAPKSAFKAGHVPSNTLSLSIEIIVLKYLDGTSTIQIAKEFGCSWLTVCNRLKKAGVTIRTNSEASKGRSSPTKDSAFSKEHEAKSSTAKKGKTWKIIDDKRAYSERK